VCGQEFDGAEDNLGALWSHICKSLPDDAVSSLSSVDLSKPLKLGLVPLSRDSSGGRVALCLPATRPPKAIEVLIGMAGQIQHSDVFRHSMEQLSLRLRHGFSGNSISVCDFRFTAGDWTFFVEVKSSSGTDETFTLGSSEIRLAMDLANRHDEQRSQPNLCCDPRWRSVPRWPLIVMVALVLGWVIVAPRLRQLLAA
jgi:hypothetical protein